MQLKAMPVSRYFNEVIVRMLAKTAISLEVQLVEDSLLSSHNMVVGKV